MGGIIPVHVLMFLPAILMGIIGGVLGATFTLLNVRIVRQRAALINRVHGPAAKKFLKMLEPVIIMVRAISMLVTRLSPSCRRHIARHFELQRLQIELSGPRVVCFCLHVLVLIVVCVFLFLYSTQMT